MLIKKHIAIQNNISGHVISHVCTHRVALSTATAFAAELDACASLAQVATQLNLVRPSLVQQNVLVIKGGGL